MRPLFFLLLLTLVGCGDNKTKTEPGTNPADTTTPTTTPVETLAVYYTCDTRGHLYPCDCPGGKAGGITRRAHWIKQQQDAAHLLVDVGNNTSGARRWELIQYEHLLESYQAMGYHAVNLGHREALLDAATLRDLAQRFPFLISANLVDADLQPAVNPHVIVTLPDGTRLGIIGVMSAEVDPAELDPELQLLGPAEAILQQMETLEDQTDRLVLLAFADENHMERLAADFFEISLIVGGNVRQPSTEARQANQSLIVSNTDKAKSIGRLEIAQLDGQWNAVTNSVHMLYLEQPEDPAMQEFLQRYEQAMRAEDFDPEQQLIDDEEGLTTLDAGGDS